MKLKDIKFSEQFFYKGRRMKQNIRPRKLHYNDHIQCVEIKYPYRRFNMSAGTHVKQIIRVEHESST